jgi:deoxyribonuclease (pyrimidine dimer)
MTRINLVEPKLLADNHLMAEYRELPMIAASLNRSLKSKTGLKDIPKNYILGTGHVSHFYNKGLFLYNRYNLLVNELKRRKFNLNDERVANFEIFKVNNLYHDWVPNNADNRLNAARIVQKLNMKLGWYRYMGVKLTDLDQDTLSQVLLENYI